MDGITSFELIRKPNDETVKLIYGLLNNGYNKNFDIVNLNKYYVINYLNNLILNNKYYKTEFIDYLIICMKYLEDVRMTNGDFPQNTLTIKLYLKIM